MADPPDLRTYRVLGAERRALVNFIEEGLAAAGCRMLYRPEPHSAPFRFVFETPWAERLGFVIYLFRSTTVLTRNRPNDEARFQVKYGPKTDEFHTIFDDPFGMYTTVFGGVDLEHGIFVAADPALHNPTRFYISIEYKTLLTDRTLESGWGIWEREKRDRAEPIEILVACVKERILDLLLFERAARGLAPGHRQLLAEDFARRSPAAALADRQRALDPSKHTLLAELAVDIEALLDVIENADRLKMAVRGWVAEHHLARKLLANSIVRDVTTIAGDGQPDLLVTLATDRQLRIECKNCLRACTSGGLPRVDFMRTRASKSDPCSRYYAPTEFEVVAACLHPVTKSWEFAFTTTDSMRPHRSCPGKLDNRVVVDDSWLRSFDEVAASLTSP